MLSWLCYLQNAIKYK